MSGSSGGGGRTTLGLEGALKGGSGETTQVTRADVTELKGHKGEVLVCSWNPRMDVLASGSGDSTVRLWSVPRGASGLPASTAASQDPRVLVHTDSALSKDVTTLDWRADGQRLATGTYDGQARIWSLRGEPELKLGSHRGTIFALKWNKSGSRLLSGSVDKTATVWDATTGQVVQQLGLHQAPILDVDWRDDDSFATCSTDKAVLLCRVGDKEPLQRFVGHANEVNAVKWSPSGALLASCSDDRTAKLWKPEQSACVLDLDEHAQDIYQVKWTPLPSSHLLATASSDATIKTWDVETGRCLHTLAEHQKAVYSVNFSPDGQFLASGSMDATLRIWSVKDGKCVRKYKGGGGIYEVCWNKDGDKVAACFGLPSNSVSVIDFRK